MATFTLDKSMLGGSRWIQRFQPAETGGEFRAIQFDVQDNVDNSDLELHSIGSGIVPGDKSLEDL